MEKDREAVYFMKLSNKPLMSDREIVAFALRFTEMDLNLLRKGDRINLREDLSLILRWKPNREEQVSEEELVMLQKKVTWLLHAIVRTFHSPSEDPEDEISSKWPGDAKARPDVGSLDLGGEKTLLIILPSKSLKKVVLRSNGRNEKQRRVEADDLAEEFFDILSHALWQIGLDWLRECPSCK